MVEPIMARPSRKPDQNGAGKVYFAKGHRRRPKGFS
jgi:hypothetical protein